MTKQYQPKKTLQSIIESIRNCKGPDYTYLDTPPINNQNGGIQGGNIRVALLFRNVANISYSTRFEQMNYSDSVLNQLNLTTNPAMLFANEEVFLGTRKPLLWIFNWKDQEFIIIGLHLVSQSAKSPDWGNIQPPVNPEQEVREAQMLLVRDIVKKLLRENAERNIIVVGDLNDYQWSHTLSLLQEAGLEILKNDLSESFSYIHEGNAFQFDYAAVSSQLVVHIENYSILHVNTLQDKSTQVSDHDPVYFEVSQR